MEKFCKGCMRTYPKTLEYFYKNRVSEISGKIILKSLCKNCIKERSRKQGKRCPINNRKRQKKFQRNKKIKELEKKGKTPKEIEEFFIKRQYRKVLREITRKTIKIKHFKAKK